MRISYLPKISEHIEHSKLLFKNAMKKYNYKGSYTYCYCTKSSHFKFILETALKNNIHLETSSAFDMPLVKTLLKKVKSAKKPT